MNTAADIIGGSIYEALTYHALPDVHRQEIRTTKPLARIMKEIQRFATGPG
jgi:transposase-like protein